MSSSRAPRIISEIPTTWAAIFHFPSFEAAIVIRSPAAIARIPETANSLPTMMQTAHASASWRSTREMRAAETRILSAIGSSSIPSVVTFLYLRAIQPSRKSVSAATRKTPSATYSLAGIRVRRMTTRSGTRKMRKSVSAFGRFGTAAHSRRPLGQMLLPVLSSRVRLLPSGRVPPRIGVP